MTTRQTIVHPKEQDHIPTGYDPLGSSPADYFIPSCGIEDADNSLFNLFDMELGFSPKDISTKNGSLQMNKPNVIFAVGERFAITKKLRPARDTNNALILPAISIRRTTIEQTDEDITGRGINQMTGALVVKRRLHASDKDYQKFLNNFLFKNLAQDGTANRREPGEQTGEVKQGMLLANQFKENVWEIITIPSPQYFTATYEVVFWTTHEKHMNYMVETLFNGFLPQRRGFKLDTDKGYWFLADVEETFTNEGNADDFTEEKRLIQYSFNIKVKGYMLASMAPGNAVPIQRYISAPTIVFTVHEATDVHKTKEINKNSFVLTDLKNDEEKSQEPTTLEKFVANGDGKYFQLSDQNKREKLYTASNPSVLAEFLYPKKTKVSE